MCADTRKVGEGLLTEIGASRSERIVMFAKGSGKSSSSRPSLERPGGKGSTASREILVVGAGCTGALVAALLPLAARRRQRPKPQVAIWEWGRGPAGRMTSFWTEGNGGRVVADVGAQVISLEDPQRLPRWMQEEVMVAENLAQNNERNPEWFHFYAPGGLPSLQRASLAEAQPTELHFNRRVMSLKYSEGCWWASYSEKGRRSPRSMQWQDFQLVIFAGTAADATQVPGISESLAPKQLQSLRQVRYDHRLCLALILKAELAALVEKFCDGKGEVVLEKSPIYLIARQDVKGRSNDHAFGLVLHSTPAFAASNLQLAKQKNRPPKDVGTAELLSCLAELLQLEESVLKSNVLDSKVVHWRQCQVQKLMSEAAQMMMVDPMMILAGDYLAKDAGSFQGCLESAEAAAEAACDLLYGPATQEPPASGYRRRCIPPRIKQLKAALARSGYFEEAAKDVLCGAMF
eukprot:symbB.v1.2.038250.t1/scaffold5887.1/size22752/2